MNHSRRFSIFVSLFLATAILPVITNADAVTEWNVRACDFTGPPTFDTPTGNRAVAIVHTAIYEAANAITKKYPPSRDSKIQTPVGASIDAAIAAAAHSTLLALLPAKKADIDAAYQASLAKVADGQSKTDGIAIGDRAAAQILAERADDGITIVESYRPYTVAGVYVPTVIPLVSFWSQRRPWLMTSTNQFRPGPPPDLKSELWARDYNEIKAIGRKTNSKRTTQQADIAQFWEATGSVIYHGIVRSVAEMPGREITRNARFMMAVSQAMDDAIIAVFDAKYHYNFWRPVTAIRNGDIDGNDATERDASWTPFINTPMHPEYPCAHCIVSATVGTILEAELGNVAVPVLTTYSPTADNAKRTWMKIDDFVQEVANGRIYDGVHFRTSTEVGTAMGRQIGKLAAAKYIQADK